MRCAIDLLSFDLLDDICLALESQKLTPDQLPISTADALGPLLELWQAAPRAISDGWLDASQYADMLRQIAASATWYSSSDHQGVVRAVSLHNDPLSWTNMTIRMKRAATRSGFSSDHAGKLVAAVGELYDNVLNHSELIGSGYVAYSAEPGRFEFVVSDAGIGILASLQTNPRYAHILDAGSALELALSEGVSRYADADHGMGFRPLFVGLANISRIVRFRSGNYGRIIDRRNDGSITAKTTQLADLRGLCCSVSCDLS